MFGEVSITWKLYIARHVVEFRKQTGLILDEAFVHVLSQMEIHAGFPVVESRVLNDSRDQVLNVHAQVDHQVGFQREFKDLLDPSRSAPRRSARAISEKIYRSVSTMNPARSAGIISFSSRSAKSVA